MRGIQLSPPIAAYLATLESLASADQPIPAPPAPPTRLDELAFYNTMILPLAAEITASLAARARIWQPAGLPSPQVSAYMAQGMTQQEAEATAQWFANMSTP
jgi:hypothetical protein